MNEEKIVKKEETPSNIEIEEAKEIITPLLERIFNIIKQVIEFLFDRISVLFFVICKCSDF